MQKLETEPISFMDSKAAKLATESQLFSLYGGGNTQIDYYAFSQFERRDALWPSLRGKKILDIGSGVNDFVAKLVAKGADAYGLDYRYLEKEKLIAENPSNPFFITSLKHNPDRYIGGLAHKLPFESETFDAVTSLDTIFGVTDKDLNLLMLNIEEGIRVLKPNGLFRFGPYQYRELTNIQRANQERVVGILKSRSDIDVFPKLPELLPRIRLIEEIGLLTIQKAA